MAKVENTELPHLDHKTLTAFEFGSLSDQVFAVSQVRYKNNEGCATGFFYQNEEKLYFVTNRHVVEDEDFYPDELTLNLHIDKMDLTRNKIFSIPLSKGGKPTWLEHPQTDKNIDIVALPVKLPSIYHVTPFSKEDFIINEPNVDSIAVPIGDDLLVVGYPDGLYDSKHNTPIIRRASLASVYPLQYQEEYYFLIDARLQSGTSGSPVLLKASRLINTFKCGGWQIIDYPHKRYLIGIHSGELNKNKKYLNLHTVWFAELIQQIVEAKRE